MISVLYTQLLRVILQSQPAYCAVWERDLLTPLQGDGWNKIWASTKGVSENVATKELAYKLLTRWACHDIGTLVHIWWGCPIAQSHWIKVHLLLQEMFSVSFLFNPWELQHNYLIKDLHIQSRHLGKYILSAAKWSLAISWLSPDIVWQQTLHKIQAIYTTEQLSARVQGSIDRFTEIWAQWISYKANKQLVL
ncbi:hypothetical protein XELAEV_18013260mg [Xenopus laevis]|uniref:Uncharacterized protein n=1 Tax=Xenopus laevis TaxID=8355 RepID=A0A974DP80_XENLA|nr:hypothetical protein XELAEV_18013260mg [Xenopus laevis]